MREYKRYTYMNSGNTRKGTSINSMKGTHEFKRKTRETHKGAWKDEAPKGQPGSTLPLRHSDPRGENLHAPGSMTWT